MEIIIKSQRIVFQNSCNCDQDACGDCKTTYDADNGGTCYPD